MRDIKRFPHPKNLVSYLGLDPLGKRSADRPFGPTRISKRGRSHARYLLIEAAINAVRVPGPLQAFYLRLRRKKGHNKAIVAAARKLACFVWHILSSEEPYRWAPPLKTYEKIRHAQILAGLPKHKPGPSQPGSTKAALKRADYNLAKIAQAQYQELIRQRT